MLKSENIKFTIINRFFSIHFHDLCKGDERTDRVQKITSNFPD